MGTLSTLVPPGERPRVVAAAARLRDAVTPLPRPPPAVVHRVCYVVAAIAPELSPRRLSLLARYACWSIVLDDQLDAAPVDPAALDRIRRGVTAVTAGDRAAAPADIHRQLAGILDELAGYGGPVEPLGRALREAVAAGEAHALLGRAVARGERPPPTVEEYLPVAAESVNYRSFGYALLALGGGAPAGPELAGLAGPLGHAAYAVRLANDLRGAAPDRAAGRLNVRRLRTAGGSPVTPRCVRREIRRRIRCHDRALHPPAGPVPGAAALGRSLRLSVRLYRLADLRPPDALSETR